MKKQIYASHDTFVTQIEQACSEVDIAQIKKSSVSFTNRVRIVENNRGKYIKK